MNFFKKTDKKNIIRRYLPLGIVVSGLIVILPAYLIDVKTDPKAYERYELFISAENVNEQLLYDSISKHLDNIKAYDCYHYSSDNYMFSNYYLTQGEMNSDLLILSSNVISDERVKLKMAPISLEGFSYYSIEEVSYGIKVYDANTKTGFLLDKIEYEDSDYYLFINKNSTHFGEYDNITFSILEDILK